MTARLVKVAGPTVAVSGLPGVALNEVVFVGEERLLGEVIRIEGDVATVQVYEDTAGLALGEPAEAAGEPLSVELGPGLLGRVFDGVQRPLTELAPSITIPGRGLARALLPATRAQRLAPTRTHVLH